MPWPTLLQSETKINVINRSVSAVETVWGVREIGPAIEQSNPSDVIIMMGTNDVARDLSLATALANLQTMIDRARASGAQVFVGTILPIIGDEFARFNQRTLDLNAGIAQLDGAQLVDVRAAFKNPDGLMADSLHPNQPGQNEIFRVYLKAINETARRKSAETIQASLNLLLTSD